MRDEKGQMTLLPWRIGRVVDFNHGEMRAIVGDGAANTAIFAWPTAGDTRIPTCEANAAFIIKAVNAHEDLVALLEATRGRIADDRRSADGHLIHRIDAALLKVKGEK